MFGARGILFLYTLTPLHPGSGASVGAVDLPIQRERITNYPILQASGVKGALRHLAARFYSDQNLVFILFGPPTESASEYGGALVFTDSRVLLFPVRAAKGLFAWITCPHVLARFARDLGIAGYSGDLGPLHQALGVGLAPGQCAVPTGSSVCFQGQTGKNVVLEDFLFQVQRDHCGKMDALAGWFAQRVFPEDFDAYWKEKITKDLVLLSDQDFRAFVETSTEVITRVKIGETGTVEQGPWDEEHLPTETLLYSVVLATAPKKKDSSVTNAEGVKEEFKRLVDQGKIMQFGGDETVGRGLVRLWLLEGGGHASGS